jgi:hypothetical protein
MDFKIRTLAYTAHCNAWQPTLIVNERIPQEDPDESKHLGVK